MDRSGRTSTGESGWSGVAMGGGAVFGGAISPSPSPDVAGFFFFFFFFPLNGGGGDGSGGCGDDFAAAAVIISLEGHGRQGRGERNLEM